jgi:hypothetical protein
LAVPLATSEHRPYSALASAVIEELCPVGLVVVSEPACTAGAAASHPVLTVSSPGPVAPLMFVTMRYPLRTPHGVWPKLAEVSTAHANTDKRTEYRIMGS